MKKARVRVEAKRLSPNASRQERLDSIQKLLRIFKRVCNDYGIMHAYKEHEFFVRECDKRRRKKMAKKIAILQEGKPEKPEINHLFGGLQQPNQ
jgi:ribosomal protein S21